MTNKRIIKILFVAALGLGMLSCSETKKQTSDTVSNTEEQDTRVAHLKTTPDEDFDTMRNYMKDPHNYPIVFNDSNRFQYAYAEALGIKPIESIDPDSPLPKGLVEIKSNPDFEVAELTHSVPYLVPEAARLLHSIGKEFNEQVAKGGDSKRKIVVTSLLRTRESINRLRKVNINASDSSTHAFGTTFDIAWNGFAGEGSNLSDEKLKQILAEILFKKRRNMDCMVKFEKKTHCFHITVTH